ncbi:acyl-CoA desaturase [uncultured Massilia sp.]|uniref:acyl-CoA desaturase n=1 Tax=uncultured Massilia sp. TaxID=169973 RepID=UPI002582B85A|nr:acyl-CoA desaturase [uncultured Massilia sp.]
MVEWQNAEGDVTKGAVRWEPVRSLWWTGMTGIAIVGGIATFSWSALAVFLAATACVLLFGHSLGSHRKLIHDSFQCPKWLEYLFVYAGVQVGLSGPLGLVRQHDLRDYAQRQADCHPYLRHGRSFWADAWWQLHCRLELDAPPHLPLRPGIGDDPFYRLLERTWMLQQLPPMILLYLAGGWSWVIWGGCARISAGVTGHWLIGWFAHNHGPMHHVVDGAAVQGRNVKLASLLTMGESWHNNHHAYPGSARLGLYAGEWDPGWWVLTFLRKCALVWGIRLPRECAWRAELRQIDDARMVSSTPRPTLAAMARDLLAVAVHVRAPRSSMTLHGPFATLPEPALRSLVGDRIALARDPGSARMALRHGDVTVIGMPAILLAFASRNFSAFVLAIILLPAALLGEMLRDRLS